ncbi:MAG: DUF4783 domain-containing protein [Chitinophagaceae bacterium]
MSHSQEYIKQINNYMSVGDAKKLSAYFDDRLDLTFNDKTQKCSRKQAIVLLENYFSKQDIILFELTHKGDSKSNHTQYLIGNLKTKTGEYKVYFFFIQKKDKYYIKELRFGN